MKLILHDLNQEQVHDLKLNEFFETEVIVIDSNEKNHYCVGCFGCWLKTPGRCVIKDEFQQMGEKLSKVDEFLIISKSTFGSYSSSVKNVLDRSISYVEPFFVIRKGEMHHKERYHKNLKISAVFYGGEMTEAEKETSRNLVKANAINLNGTLGKVCFAESINKIREVL